LLGWLGWLDWLGCLGWLDWLAWFDWLEAFLLPPKNKRKAETFDKEENIRQKPSTRKKNTIACLT